MSDGSHPVSGDSNAGKGATLLPRITIRRTGGFAGLGETVVLDAHGGWTVTRRGGAQTTGRLTADQVAPIQALAADPRLAVEARSSRPPTRCRDAFHYDVTVDGDDTADTVHIGYHDCPTDPDQPTAAIALVNRILRSAKLK